MLKGILNMIKNKKQISIRISWVAVLLRMLLIFSLSSQAAEQSGKLSTRISKVFVKRNKMIKIP